MHDHWAAYLSFADCQHAFCNTHHLRELQFAVDQYQQQWAADMAQLLRTLKAEVDAEPPTLATLLPDRLAYYTAEYDKLIAQGLTANPISPARLTPTAVDGNKNLLDRLHTHKAGILAFMADFRIPF